MTTSSSRTIDIVVPSGKIRERLDVFLTHHIENATRSKVQQAIKQGYVTVNETIIKASYKISPGDIIHVSIPKPPPPDVIPENIPLDILFEDEYLLIVNKPAGMVTHPAYGNYSGTLVNAVLYHCNNKLSSINDITRPGIIHRLDKDTSGLMVIAKDDTTHARLSKQFSQRTIGREYWAIVWGCFDKTKKTGVIEASLGRSKSDRKKIAVSALGKSAVTSYEVLEEFDYLSLVRLKLRTGRTHQIRVHLHHIGHPVFGDPTYGGRRIAWGGTDKKKKEEVQSLLKIITRQALHAKTLGFIHPILKNEMIFDSELPADMQRLLSILRFGKE
ncbi:MAG: RluA family pseudouridine synthase [Bacteroidota bacterium]|nr:RluA family pseudouridine synthase [Bacteroidota bacterium]